MGCVDMSTECLKTYFNGNPPPSQFLSRAFLCQGQLQPPPQELCIKPVPVLFVSNRCHFMVFNASVLYFQKVRPLLQPGWFRFLVPSLKVVVQSLEEVDDKDHSWRAELMILLVEGFVDSGQLEDAAGFARVTQEFITSHAPHLYPKLFTLQVMNKMEIWLLCTLLILNILFPRCGISCQRWCCAAISAERSQSAGVAPQARLKEVEALSQWLPTAVRGGGPKGVQAVCVTLWNCCLPLLQHNLRKHVKATLRKLAQVLEDTHSVLLEVRCQVHSELALIEEEEGCLEASLTHLQKAMLLGSGAQRERLLSAFHLLQLRQNIYYDLTRTEDRAATLLQQTLDMAPHVNADCGHILVSVGFLLAPEDFQTVLDAEKTPESTNIISFISFQPAYNFHSHLFFVFVEQLGFDCFPSHFFRVKLWAALAKTARKQEVWDVCRAACRFCLLYDDGRWKMSVTTGKITEKNSDLKKQTPMTEQLNLCLVQATIQMLVAEGVQPNSLAVPSQERWPNVSEADWAAYRDWIHSLSAYATSNFMRAGQLGAEIGEPWVVANAAIYLWNYNSHLLFGAFVVCVSLRNTTLCVLLCDAVARGLIQPISERDSAEPAHAGLKGKNRAEKRSERAASTRGASTDPAALHHVHKALEVSTGETVPLAVRKQVLTTWVQIKMLLQQQIDMKMDCKSEEASAMTSVLVGVEMHKWNKSLGHTDFSVPSLSTLVNTASECSWSDAVVELQVWCQLAASCHRANDHSSVLRCTLSALQLEEAAAKSLNTTPCVLFLGLWFYLTPPCPFHSFAKEAENAWLCVTAAGHYWSASLALTQDPQERWQLREDLEMVLNALVHISRCERVSAHILLIIHILANDEFIKYFLSMVNTYCIKHFST
uniref:Cilia and flagella associated protein 46 n=1 Tax=Oryzias latipes TaxID=8090 RepID=A0A3P9HU19_ORYLA